MSPLLSNIILTELDEELEKRGLRFVRYADDVNISIDLPAADSFMKRVQGMMLRTSGTRAVAGSLECCAECEELLTGAQGQGHIFV